jgi:MoaA/NifB/PqqE/SkfB family radical SAM enzyme
MSMESQFKELTAKEASKMILRLLDWISEERLIQMVQLAKRLTRDAEVLDGLNAIENLLLSNHPSKQLFYRVLEKIPKKNRYKIYNSLFYHAWFQGGSKREAFAAEHGFHAPFIMILSPTFHCNLRCKGCYTLGYGTRPELEYELVKRILAECMDIGLYFVTILGGEPLLYPHLFQMIEEHPDMFFQVYTNGTLLTPEAAQRFTDLGNVMVVVSIEGNEEETDSWRGKGVYRKIMNAFDNLNRAHMIFGTSATVTSANEPVVSSFEFVDRMIELGSVVQNYFLYVPVNGKADFNLMVTPEQRNHLRKQVLAIRNSRPIFVLDFWNDGPYICGCIAAGRRYFHINAKGDVEPCVYTHVAMHNIRDVSLTEALKSPLFQCIRSIQPHNQNHLRPCMIIDNPSVLREVIQEIRPYFTHPGAEEIFTTKADEMDAYAARFAELADRVWEEEYLKDEHWRERIRTITEREFGGRMGLEPPESRNFYFEDRICCHGRKSVALQGLT